MGICANCGEDNECSGAWYDEECDCLCFDCAELYLPLEDDDEPKSPPQSKGF